MGTGKRIEDYIDAFATPLELREGRVKMSYNIYYLFNDYSHLCIRYVRISPNSYVSMLRCELYKSEWIIKYYSHEDTESTQVRE